MKVFLKAIFVFIIVFFLADKLFYFKIASLPNNEIDNRLELVLDGKMNKEVLVFGSSRAQHNLLAYLLEKKTHLKTYNLGYRGSSIDFQLYVLKKVLKYNKKPLQIILTLDDDKFLDVKALHFRLDRLFPLVRYQEITNELIRQKQISPFAYFLYSARLNPGSFKAANKNKKEDKILACGSSPLGMNKKKLVFHYADENVYDKGKESKEKVTAFHDFQQLCKDNKIALTLVLPPNFKAPSSSFKKRIQELAFPGTKLYFYAEKDNRYKEKSNFYDVSHLNKNGAIIFTNELAHFLIEKDEKNSHNPITQRI